jgi:protein-tyrosine phosphatase
MEAISILGREVMNPRGLVGLGYDSIDHCGKEIAMVSDLSIGRTS